MAAFSPTLANAVLDTTLRNASYTLGTATVYLALFTTPTPGGTEVAGSTGYTRQPITFSAAVSGASHNIGPTSPDPTGNVTFPVATTPYTVTHCAIMSSGGTSGGTMLYHGPVAAPKAVGVSEAFRVLASSLSIGLV